MAVTITKLTNGWAKVVLDPPFAPYGDPHVTIDSHLCISNQDIVNQLENMFTS